MTSMFGTIPRFEDSLFVDNTAEHLKEFQQSVKRFERSVAIERLERFEPNRYGCPFV